MKKKIQLVFSTYLHVFLLKFRVGAPVGWGTQFLIQRVPTEHNFGGTLSMKNKKYTKKCDADITFFNAFLIFRGHGSTKSMLSGYL